MKFIFSSLLFLSISLCASVTPKQILAKNCLESYQNSYTSQNKHKAFVYAREKHSGKDRCNWAYGHSNVRDAIDSAMKGCQSFILNAECVLVDTDGVFKVKDGVFTVLEPLDTIPLSIEKKKSLEIEAKKIILGNCLPFFTKNYLEAKGHKSFAYSVDENGNYACGYAYENQTKNISQKRAIASCEENKIKRGDKKPISPCKVYATAHKILLNLNDFGITNTAKKKVSLSTESYTQKLNQAKKMIDEGACLMQMKYYLRGEEHQAYYFAKSEGKQACGREEGAFTLDVAKVNAKENCEKMAKEKKIKSGCTLLAQNFEIIAQLDTSKKGTSKKITTKKVNAEAVRDLFLVVKKKQTQNAKAKPLDMNKPQSLEKSIYLAVQTYNKNLPSMMDEELRLDKVSAEGNKMIFHYTLVHFTPQSMGENKLKSLMYEDIKTQVCTDKDTKIMLKKGMLVDYMYIGKNKKHITTFAFDAKTCGYITNVEQIKKNILNMLKPK